VKVILLRLQVITLENCGNGLENNCVIVLLFINSLMHRCLLLYFS